ncbi:MAG: MBL fold metallo-hydrolase [Candidatus Limnocylindria bacterium]
MKITFWGARGSLASAGPETVRYGGNTACVEVRSDDGQLLILDAGTGIRRLGATIDGAERIDILLSHLHLDHIQGLGFFTPLFQTEGDVHLWGPPSPQGDLRSRLSRYLSPPLFPVRLKELGSRVILHDAPIDPVTIGSFEITSDPIIHPGATVGYRIAADGRSIAYLPDHEPALGVDGFPGAAEWTSGYALARGVDLVIHDAQYSRAEYEARVGWGHSSLDHAIAFAELAEVAILAPFHHDPAHSDADLDATYADLPERSVRVIPAQEGATLEI